MLNLLTIFSGFTYLKQYSWACIKRMQASLDIVYHNRSSNATKFLFCCVNYFKECYEINTSYLHPVSGQNAPLSPGLPLSLCHSTRFQIIPRNTITQGLIIPGSFYFRSKSSGAPTHPILLHRAFSAIPHLSCRQSDRFHRLRDGTSCLSSSKSFPSKQKIKKYISHGRICGGFSIGKFQ